MSKDASEPLVPDDVDARVDNRGAALRDETLLPLSSPDGRYGLLHRDLIWDCLGSGQAGPAAALASDPDAHLLLASLPPDNRDKAVSDDVDFDAVDPAYIESMGLQPPEQPECVELPVTSAGKAGRLPVSPVVVEHRPVADDDRWWLHPDDERSDISRI